MLFDGVVGRGKRTAHRIDATQSRMKEITETPSKQANLLMHMFWGTCCGKLTLFPGPAKVFFVKNGEQQSRHILLAFEDAINCLVAVEWTKSALPTNAVQQSSKEKPAKKPSTKQKRLFEVHMSGSKTEV